MKWTGQLPNVTTRTADVASHEPFTPKLHVRLECSVRIFPRDFRQQTVCMKRLGAPQLGRIWLAAPRQSFGCLVLWFSDSLLKAPASGDLGRRTRASSGQVE